MNNLKFLVVDDEDMLRFIITHNIKALGYSNIDHAENGQVAIDKCKEKKYDIIFMDLTMPVCDGLKATKEIKANNNCKVVVVTAYGNDVKIKNECKLSGANGFKLKPMRKGDVQKIVNLYLDNKFDDNFIELD